MKVSSETTADSFRGWEMARGIVYGPIQSRRFQLSLGINLLPATVKLCNFDCLYCQCGWTRRELVRSGSLAALLPAIDEIEKAIDLRLRELAFQGVSLDSIVFSGNGEPTLHPEFAAATEIVEARRARLLPTARTGILTNGSTLADPRVRQAVSRLNIRCVKLDAGMKWLNRPFLHFDPEKLIPVWAAVPNLTVQSFFCQGRFDNTGARDVDPWIEQICRVRPRQVHLYTLDRHPAAPGIVRAPLTELTRIARQLARELGTQVKVFE